MIYFSEYIALYDLFFGIHYIVLINFSEYIALYDLLFGIHCIVLPFLEYIVLRDLF